MLNEDSPSSNAGGVQDFTSGASAPPILVPQSNAVTTVACVGGFLVPGLGHLILKRWVRGALLLVSILLMFTAGLAMDGALYPPPDPAALVSFNTLGALANAGTGVAYVVTLQSGLGKGVPTAQSFDYGWAYLIVAGLLNYLAVLDAFDIARGRKP
jgi:hypothetical protein